MARWIVIGILFCVAVALQLKADGPRPNVFGRTLEAGGTPILMQIQRSPDHGLLWKQQAPVAPPPPTAKK